MKTIVGVFADHQQAESALSELKDAGYSTDELSLVAKGEEGREGEQMEMTNQNLSDGAATGGALGGAAGLLASAGALAIPGIGPVLAAGPIAAGLSGSVAGGLTGALVDYGIDEQQGQDYAEEVRQGNMLAIYEGAESKEAANEVATIMQGHGAMDIQSY
ncbi:MAG: general stress protein [Bacillota bacterium]